MNRVLIMLAVFLNISVFLMSGYAASDYNQDLMPYKVGEKFGYQDKSGKTVIPPKFDFAFIFSGRLAAVRVGGKWGFINNTGEFVIQAKFDGAGYFSEELANVEMGGKWGFIDEKGDFVIIPRFDRAGEFSEGFAAVKLGDKWGYIDKIGTTVIDPKFQEAYIFKEGVAGVKIGSKWGFINKKGEIVINPQFESFFEYNGPIFYSGRAIVKVEGELKIIDRRGEIIEDNWLGIWRNEEMILYFDEKSIVRPVKNIVRAWAKIINLEKLTFEMLLWEIDCSERKLRLLSFTKYDKEAKITASHTIPNELLRWDFIIPNTSGYTLYSFTCEMN